MSQSVLFSVEFEGEWRDVVRVPEHALNRIGLEGRERSYTIAGDTGAEFVKVDTAHEAHRYNHETDRPLPWLVTWVNDAGEVVRERKVMMKVQSVSPRPFVYLRVSDPAVVVEEPAQAQ